MFNDFNIKKNNKSFFLSILSNSWWVIIFLLVSFIGYDISIKKKDKAVYDLKQKLICFKLEKEEVLKSKQDLSARVKSQSDPLWIEQVLMKELGVVPENQIKVRFED